MCCSRQKGFTIVELLVAVAIIGILSAATVMTFGVVTKTGTTTVGQSTTLGAVHMAGNWIMRDMQNARTGTVQTTVGDTLCSMQCRTGDGFLGTADGFSTDNVTYRIDGGILTRESQPIGGSSSAKTITVARYIVGPGQATTWFSAESANVYYKLTVTADDAGSIDPPVTRVYNIKRGY